MIRRTGPLFVVALMFMLAFAGCSNDSIGPNDDIENNNGLISGEIDASGGSFEYLAETAGDPENPIAGPFIIRGFNIHYVDSLNVLSVDFTVENRSRCNCPEPIGMTFVRLLPQGVTVENPDNNINGPGAAIIFEFANDDGVWTPFEESFPRTVHFGVDSGVSIGFVARIDIGMTPGRGSIGGVVWNDINENGMRDPDEAGIGEVVINMYRTDGPELSTRPEILWRAVTARDGSYRFDGLDAGYYEVHKLPRSDLRPTTAEKIQVILVEVNGRVSSFLEADFGCVHVGLPRPIIENGDFVDVWGGYQADPRHMVLARMIRLTKCDNSRPEAMVFMSDNPADIDVCDLRVGALTAEVTDINREARVLWIMGTPVHFDSALTDTIPGDSTDTSNLPGDAGLPPGEELDFDDVGIGMRIIVFAVNIPEHRTLDGLKIYRAPETAFVHEVEVHGKVDHVFMTPNSNGMIDGFVVMRTTVVITQTTQIEVRE
jgi:hypothetical protein